MKRMGDDHNGTNQVMRGGSWINNARNVRAAYRNHSSPGNRNDNLGFRLARAHERIGDPSLTRPSSCPGSVETRQKPQGRRCVSSQSGGCRRESSPVARPWVVFGR